MARGGGGVSTQPETSSTMSVTDLAMLRGCPYVDTWALMSLVNPGSFTCSIHLSFSCIGPANELLSILWIELLACLLSTSQSLPVVVSSLCSLWYVMLLLNSSS